MGSSYTSTGRQPARESLRTLLLQRYSILVVATLAAVIVAVGPIGGDGSNAGSQSALAWREPAITVSSPDPRVVPASEFGADIVNFDDTQWGPSSDASWPPVSLGMVRIWDDGSTWADLEPAPGEWNFSALDRQVTEAHSKGARVLYVLGQTPRWASSLPDSHDIYGAGAPAPPADLQLWRNYVSTVVSRYKGEISAYEIWDEADASTFDGSPQEMVELATIAYRTIKEIQPSATVLTPSFTQNALTDGWLAAYLKDGGGKVADALAGHAYPDYPEQGAGYVLQYRSALAHAGLHLPIWITEVGYSGYTASGQALFPALGAQAYVAKTLMDQAEVGAAEIIWYGANTNGMWLSLGEQGYPSDAQAYSTMVRWLVGAIPRGCGEIASGPYSGLTACYLDRPGAPTEVVFYDSIRSLTMSAPSSGTFEARTLSGRVTALTSRSTLTVGNSPILVTSSR